MRAGWAPNFICPWQCRIRPHILQHNCFFSRGMVHFISKYTPIRWICVFFIPTTSTEVHELLPFLVFNWREQVIALGTKTQRWSVTCRHDTVLIFECKWVLTVVCMRIWKNGHFLAWQLKILYSVKKVYLKSAGTNVRQTHSFCQFFGISIIISIPRKINNIPEGSTLLPKRV